MKYRLETGTTGEGGEPVGNRYYRETGWKSVLPGDRLEIGTTGKPVGNRFYRPGRKKVLRES